jgi:hypothetical protein
MAKAPGSGNSVEARANDLYWNSTSTIGELLEELGMSRAALYGAVQPYAYGADCPECGQALAYMNRSQRATGRLTCTGCGERFDADEVDAAPRSTPRQPSRDGRAAEPYAEAPGVAYWSEMLAAVPRERALMIGGAAFVGLVAGAVAARLLRDRG